MKVRDLIKQLEKFDGNMKVKIRVEQRHDSNLVMDIEYEVEEHKIHTIYGDEYNAVLIMQDVQCGTVD